KAAVGDIHIRKPDGLQLYPQGHVERLHVDNTNVPVRRQLKGDMPKAVRIAGDADAVIGRRYISRFRPPGCDDHHCQEQDQECDRKEGFVDHGPFTLISSAAILSVSAAYPAASACSGVSVNEAAGIAFHKSTN